MNIMQVFIRVTLLAVATSITQVAQASPVMVNALRNTAQIYVIYFVSPTIFNTSAKVFQVQSDLASQLAPQGLLPCYSSADLNSTDIRCGSTATGGQMQLGINELFGYNLETLQVKAPLVKDSANNNLKGVTQLFVSNFLSPNPITGTPGDTLARISRIHFTARMAQFGLLVDPGIFGTLNTIQFIVNEHALPPQKLTPGMVQFVGVEDSHGFTDVTIIGSGANQAYIGDRLAFVPLSKF